jgi:hypothetical protein
LEAKKSRKNFDLRDCLQNSLGFRTFSVESGQGAEDRLADRLSGGKQRHAQLGNARERRLTIPLHCRALLSVEHRLRFCPAFRAAVRALE